jgi:DNA-binding NarL/FixJ family response regulator
VGRTVLAYRAAQAALVQETVAARGSTEDRADGSPAPRARRALQAVSRRHFATPATNQQIAAEIFLSVDAVKMHLRSLFAKFQLSELAQNQKRAKLAEQALKFGVISPRDLA